MDEEAGWWTTGGKIGLSPLARVMGVGRQQHRELVVIIDKTPSLFEHIQAQVNKTNTRNLEAYIQGLICAPLKHH